MLKIRDGEGGRLNQPIGEWDYLTGSEVNFTGE